MASELWFSKLIFDYQTPLSNFRTLKNLFLALAMCENFALLTFIQNFISIKNMFLFVRGHDSIWGIFIPNL